MFRLPLITFTLLVFAPGSVSAFDQTHSTLGRVLEAHVHKGRVSYGELAADSGLLTHYLASVAKADLTGFSKNEKKAFYINAYNALTLHLIVEKREQKSITNIRGAWKRITHQVAGTTLTLDAIEHEILRAHYGDARLHAALVCAAMSCPSLASVPYQASKLDAQLDQASRNWVRDPTKNSYNPSTKILHVSKIFDWFDDDFRTYAKNRDPNTAAGIQGFLSTYLATPIPADARIEYRDYNWSLNGSW